MALWSALIARPARTPLASRPSLTLYFLLAGAFLLTLVPHVIQFPAWLTAVVIGSVALRSFIEVYRLPLPSTTFCGILAIILLGLILLQYGTVMGRDPGTAFTAGLLAIKFYEIRRPRDISLIIFSSFFVVMSALLYSQVLELFIYCLIMMWVLTALLVRVHTGDLPTDLLLRMLQKSGLIFVQAAPLALLLFFFFPRYQGPLGFSLNEPAIGLTDTLEPGSIAKLSKDDSEAMYVRFLHGNIPTTDSMYWRALVLWHYENGVWTMGDVAVPTNNTPMPDASDVEQEIIIRANNQRWLYALDAPTTLPANSSESRFWAENLNDGTIRLAGATSKLDHLARYTVVSSSIRPAEKLTRKEKFVGTRLPDIDPAVKDLAATLHQGIEADDEQRYILAVLKFFRHGGFIYSTDPGQQGPNWLSEFLFQRKTGFCEHYAASFAILMRLQGIPARVVAGYVGGDYNPYTNAYTVSQSNAHAWDEVWIKSKDNPTLGRWTRYDPTAILAAADETVTPNNSANQADSTAIRIAASAPSFAEAYLPGWLRNDFREVRLRREEVETNWDNLVLSYDTGAQFRLAQALGFGESASFELLMVCLTAGVISTLIFRTWVKRKPAIPPVETLYATFCRHMARRGIPRATWEGPLAYTDRVAEAFPEDKPAIQNVGTIVANVRYGPTPATSSTFTELESSLRVITASQAAATSREKS